LSFSLVSARTLALRIPSAKIDEFITQNPDLPDFDKNCLLTGEFQVGIRAETLKFMFGEPRSMKTVRQPWAVQEEWFYRIDRNRLYFTIENGGVVGIEER
jgi:hypothetical protein